MALFYVEHTNLDEFPSTLQHLGVDDLSLIGNRIQEISEFPSQSSPSFIALVLSENSLMALSNFMGDTRDLGFLSIDNTQIATFPTWMDSAKKSATAIHAFGTPFCRNLSDTQREASYGASTVLMRTDVNDRQGGKYPLAVMAPKRPL